MPSLKEIKTRIASVNSTRKITSAMKMVASSKLHHAQVAIQNMLPYGNMLEHILKSFLVSTPNVDHPLQLEHKETKRVALVVYSSNSSLCGGFNSNVIKMMMHAVDEYKAQGIDDITVYPIGRKVAEKAQKLGLKIGGNFNDLADHPHASACADIAHSLAKQYAAGELDKVEENHGGIYKNLRALRQSNGTCEHNWFKAWGFEYKYLEEGNDIEKLIQVFESVKDTDKPTVVHIHTEKGHGFAPAVANKEAWHWGMPFNLEDGSRPRRNADGTLPEIAPTEDYGTLFSDWMLSEMKQDKTLIAVTAGTPTAGGFTADKRQLAGKQHIDMGIAEEQAVAMISGMAKGGLHPVWTVYSTFIQRTYDQIAQDLCINSNPAVINVVGGGVNSMNDITHICLFDIPMLCSIPGLIYLAPTTCEEYFAMLRWSILQDKKPIAIRVPSNGVVHTSEAVDAEYGYEAKYKVMHQGEKVAVIAAGSFYQKGENVVRLLAQKGIDATLINPRYLNEVDAETLDSLKANHQLVVTLEDGSKDGGFGERIASYYGTSEMKVMVGGIRKGLYDRYDVQQLLSDNRLLDEQIVEDVLLVIND